MAKKKAASKPTAKDVAAKVDKAAPGTATAQALIPDAFAPREPEIERARKSLARAAAESKKVGEKKRAAYQDLKSAMFEAGLTVYKSHDAPVVITLEPEGAPVKMRDVKEDEATPYKPGKSDDDEQAPGRQVGDSPTWLPLLTKNVNTLQTHHQGTNSMPKHREITLKFPAVYQIGVPFATVRGNHQEVLIVTMDDEWLTDEQLREKAERVRKRLAMRRERQAFESRTNRR